MNGEIEPYYQNQAKQFIDSMFDAKVFNTKMTRDDMLGFEGLLAFYFQSQHDSTVKSCELLEKVKHLK